MRSQRRSSARQAKGAGWIRWLASASVLGVALALLACGGDGGDKESSSPTATPTASKTTQTPTATSRPSSSPTTTSGGAGTLPATLPDLTSYRYSFRIEGTAGLIAELSRSSLPPGVNPNTGTLVFEAKGAYLKPDRGEVTVTFGSANVTIVAIGRQQWTRVDGVLAAPRQLTSPGEDDYSYIADFWDTSASEALKDFSCSSSRETVNGVSTRKCTADRATVERLNREGKLFTTGVLDLKQYTAGTAELWVADGDKVIRFRANLAGKDSSNRDVAFKMEVDISDINARFTIDPPR